MDLAKRSRVAVDTVPTSVLLVVFAFLDWRTLVLHVAKVCTTWKLASKQSEWSDVSWLSPPTFRQVLHALGPCVKHLKVHIGFTSAGAESMIELKAALGRCSRLRKLAIRASFDGGFAGGSRPLRLLRALSTPCLESLTYVGDVSSFRWTNSNMVGLSRLVLYYVKLEARALNLLTSLETLTLVSCRVTDGSLPVGLSLKRLSLTRVRGVSTLEISRVDTLKTLTLREVEGLELDVCLAKMRLRRLRVVESDRDGCLDLASLAEHLKVVCPSLKTIAVSTVDREGDCVASVIKEF